MIPVRFLPNAIELLKQRYFFLDDTHMGIQNIKRCFDKVIYVQNLNFEVYHNIYEDQEGSSIIKGISVKIVTPVSVRGRTFNEYL